MKPLFCKQYRLSLSAAMLLVASTAFAQDASIGSVATVDGKVRLDIVSLNRTEGDTLTLKFKVTNKSNESFSVTTANMRLIDIVGRRIYTPGVTSPGCSTPVEQTFSCYAIFGAPPAGTRKINVQFYEKVDLISGVPISE